LSLGNNLLAKGSNVSGAIQAPRCNPIVIPSVVGHNLQCQPVRGVDTRQDCYWSHAWKNFKRTCVGSNGILECISLSKNAHRTTAPHSGPSLCVVKSPIRTSLLSSPWGSLRLRAR
jgi:hypothetical protein